MTTTILGNAVYICGSDGINGDNLSYGSAPLVGYAVVGCGLCTPLPHVGEAVVGDIL